MKKADGIFLESCAEMAKQVSWHEKKLALLSKSSHGLPTILIAVSAAVAVVRADATCTGDMSTEFLWLMYRYLAA